ncbi:MAG: GDP-mannose 4,6-dehydratase [bacterium]|nr:GDP-mannose 4,6-dehydratase [bacterium]
MMRVLVTGADGFVGHHMVTLLKQKGIETIGTALDAKAASDLVVPVRPLNITKTEEVASLIKHIEPTHIIHLAGVSSVMQSFFDPNQADDVNVKGTENILASGAMLKNPPLTLLIGSSDEYGMNDGNPIREGLLGALNPLSPYAQSKKAVEVMVENNATYLKHSIRTRSFPHIGPGQQGQFFVPEVATQIVRIERGQQRPVIGIGNLSAVRDFTDVRDVVRAYYLLLEKGVVGEVYNVCSGTAMSIEELLRKMIALSKFPVKFEHDPEKERPIDIPVLKGDGSKLKEVTGWVPEIPLDKTLKDIIEYFRSRGT